MSGISAKSTGRLRSAGASIVRMFVFSTGAFIDSLKLSGTVVNAQTLRGEKNVLVMLYRDTKDSVVFKQKPYYYTRTDDNGNYQITNLAASTYKIFALDDEGEDYLYNTPEERIAFSERDQLQRPSLMAETGQRL